MIDTSGFLSREDLADLSGHRDAVVRAKNAARRQLVRPSFDANMGV